MVIAIFIVTGVGLGVGLKTNGVNGNSGDDSGSLEIKGKNIKKSFPYMFGILLNDSLVNEKLTLSGGSLTIKFKGRNYASTNLIGNIIVNNPLKGIAIKFNPVWDVAKSSVLNESIVTTSTNKKAYLDIVLEPYVYISTIDNASLTYDFHLSW